MSAQTKQQDIDWHTEDRLKCHLSVLLNWFHISSARNKYALYYNLQKTVNGEWKVYTTLKVFGLNTSIWDFIYCKDLMVKKKNFWKLFLFRVKHIFMRISLMLYRSQILLAICCIICRQQRIDSTIWRMTWSYRWVFLCLADQGCYFGPLQVHITLNILFHEEQHGNSID